MNARSVAPAFIFAGLNHFIMPKMYEKIMPHYLPAHKELVQITGAMEIASGALAMHPKTRRAGRWSLLATLFIVTPANLDMALHPDRWPKVPKAALWFRIFPGQFLWMWWIIAGTREDAA